MKKIDPLACKGNIPYYTFISPEAVKAICEYLEERVEKYGGIEDDDEILFCSDSNRLPLEIQRKTPVSSNGLERMVKATVRKAGIKNGEMLLLVV